MGPPPPPPPWRQPAARPGTSDSPPGTGMGRGRAGGGGARGAPAKLPTARALRRAPGPCGRDHPPRVRPRGAVDSGEPSAPRRGEGREEEEERGRKMKGEQTCLGVSREPQLARALPAPRA